MEVRKWTCQGFQVRRVHIKLNTRDKIEKVVAEIIEVVCKFQTNRKHGDRQKQQTTRPNSIQNSTQQSNKNTFQKTMQQDLEMEGMWAVSSPLLVVKHRR